jgi:hypothetical protein
MAIATIFTSILGVGGKIASVIIGNLVNALVSEKVIMRLFIMFGDKLVNSTSTTLDNDAWNEIKPELEKTIK